MKLARRPATVSTSSGADPLEVVEALYNDTEGPTARMVAWRAAIECILDVFGVKYRKILSTIYIERPPAVEVCA